MNYLQLAELFWSCSKDLPYWAMLKSTGKNQHSSMGSSEKDTYQCGQGRWRGPGMCHGPGRAWEHCEGFGNRQAGWRVMSEASRGFYCCLYNFAQGLTIAAYGSSLLHCQIPWPVGRAGLFHLGTVQGSQQRSTLMKGGNLANKSQRFLNSYCPFFFLLACFFSF